MASGRGVTETLDKRNKPKTYNQEWEFSRNPSSGGQPEIVFENMANRANGKTKCKKCGHTGFKVSWGNTVAQ